MKKLSGEEIELLRKIRWRARTDLQFLCAEILGFKHVESGFHGPLIDFLQQFPKPTRRQAESNDYWTGKTWNYIPLTPIMSLDGPRRRLVLDSRSSLKTTINTIAHSIQWLLNYPDIAIAVFQSNLDKAVEIVRAIKRVFQYNDRFREIFPEFCPWKSVDNWGTQQQFVVECREKAGSVKEASVTALALGAGTAGKHFHVMKFSDVVEPENTKSQDRMLDTRAEFLVAENLLVTLRHWIDVEGTRYKFGDLYGDIIDRYRKDLEEDKVPEYKIFARGCFQKVTPDGSPQRFTPEELDNETHPYKKDSEGHRITHWPRDCEGGIRQDLEALERMERTDIVGFNSQQLNNPIGGAGGVTAFPVSAQRPVVISRQDYNNNVRARIVYRTVTVDTAHTQKKHSSYSSICVAAWDWNNRCYVEEIQHGQWLPTQLISKIINVLHRYKPFEGVNSHRFELFMEKIPFNESLYLFIQREMSLGNWYVPLVFLPRSNDTSKEDRIQAALSPYYNDGNLRFLSDLGHYGSRDKENEAARLWEHLRKELKEFPTGRYKDILDSIADQFYGKEDQMGRLVMRPQEHETPDILRYLQLKDIGLEDIPEAAAGRRWAMQNGVYTPQHPHFSKTGGL